MEAVDARLVRRDKRLVLLLDPPFNHMHPSPGYIQGYLPGVRENGGQYTHAALWAVSAVARMNDGDRALEYLGFLNPVQHSQTAAGVARYRVEPYAIAGDVYSTAPHTGRGGWTWYTGSSGWMYRVAVEDILGLTCTGRALQINPCIPRGWTRYEMTFTRSDTRYHIVVENPDGVCRGVRFVRVDDREQFESTIALVDDRATHEVLVVMGSEETRTDGTDSSSPG